MKLIQIAKRGADKLLSDSQWLSASFDTETRTIKHATLWFRDSEYESRYRVEMDREEIESLRDSLNRWIEGIDS